MPKIVTIELSDASAFGLAGFAKLRTDSESAMLRESTGDPDAKAAAFSIEEMIGLILDDMTARAAMAGTIPEMPSIDELVPS